MTEPAAIRRDHAHLTEPEDTTRNSAIALLSVCLGFFVIQLDVTIVNVALPAIQREIGGSLAGLQWVIDAYTLALASIMLTAGSTADRIGARKVFVLGLTAFAAGSAACAAAPSLGVLIAARVLQGLGASALLPCSLALLVHQFPDPRARARALGVWGGMGSLAMPAMTAVVVGAAGPEHAGVASGILNAARQSGGALGVALLGSLLGSGHALSLHVPLAVAAGGYLVALALAWIAIRGRGYPAERVAPSGPDARRLTLGGRGIGLARTPLRETDPPRVGSYQLLARLGAGGMGVVYLASGQDGRPVALKALRPEMADDAEFRTRFTREVTALTRVRGVCTVRVLDADTTSARPFLVTEYAEGPSLAEYVDSRGLMDPQMLYGLATGLAEALTAIHAAGIVHRDLKPSNVLLTGGGPKVIDFGIAQMLDATAVTRAGMTVGSAGYMAPEQIMGRAGTAADIFSWGVTIAYAASGKPPFGTGTSEVILYRILHETPDIAAVPAALHAQVAAALDKDPHGRPTAPELLSQLTRTAAVPSAGSDNPTQTVLAQTWHPAGPPPSTPSRAASSWSTPSRGAPPPDTRPPDTRPRDAPRRTGMRRPVLLTLVLAVAILLGAGGAALAFALSGHPSTSGNTPSGGTSHSPTAPATSAVTNSSAGASSPSSASSSPSSPSASSSSSSSSSSSNSSSPSATTGTTSPSQPAASTPAPG